MMIKEILVSFRNKIKLYRFIGKWKKKNKNNFTIPCNLFDENYVSIGKYTYGDLNIRMFNQKKSRLIIGSFCSIASNVVFIVNGEHKYTSFSTYPFKSNVLNQIEDENNTKGDIIIKDDVWIGEDVTILSGVTIGQGAIIGAKSIVSKDVPPYAIFAGNSIIKYRFNPAIIVGLLKIDFQKLDEEKIKIYSNYLYNEIDESFFESDFYKSLI